MEFQTVEESNPTTWSDDELIVQELLDDDSPFYLLSDEEQHYPNAEFSTQLMQLSNLHSPPTVAAPLKTWSILNSPSRGSLVERGISRIDGSKYTLKLKCCENGISDDGYKWRKYGQKSIKNSPYPRSYYKCTNRRCSAKKQVERSRDEQDTLIITYEGLHLHFAYPYFQLTPAASAAGEDHPPPPPKRPKMTTSPEAEAEAEQSQGLLEDVVPFVIRNPAAVVDSVSNLLLGSNSCSSSSSPLASSSTLSWSSQDSE
ncbi:Probable WRKY transcription factor 49 [Linum grandiflorum]